VSACAFPAAGVWGTTGISYMTISLTFMTKPKFFFKKNLNKLRCGIEKGNLSSRQCKISGFLVVKREF
jgi:hypothetical protein